MCSTKAIYVKKGSLSCPTFGYALGEFIFSLSILMAFLAGSRTGGDFSPSLLQQSSQPFGSEGYHFL